MSAFYVYRQPKYVVIVTDNLGVQMSQWGEAKGTSLGFVPERVSKVHQLHPNVHVAATGVWTVTGACFDTFSRQLEGLNRGVLGEDLVDSLATMLDEVLTAWLVKLGQDPAVRKHEVDISLCVLLTGDLAADRDRARGWNNSCFVIESSSDFRPRPVGGDAFRVYNKALTDLVMSVAELPEVRQVAAAGPFVAAQILEALHAFASRLSIWISEDCNIVVLGVGKPTVLKGTVTVWPAAHLREF
jgi:hypothetical protein